MLNCIAFIIIIIELSKLFILVRLEDSVSRADLESISPEVEKLIAVQQTKVKVHKII